MYGSDARPGEEHAVNNAFFPLQYNDFIKSRIHLCISWKIYDSAISMIFARLQTAWMDFKAFRLV